MEITTLSYAKMAVISLELLQTSAGQLLSFTVSLWKWYLSALRQRMCSVLSGKWHLVSYWEKHSAYTFFWCLLPSYCLHLQFFSWCDLTPPLKKAGNLHLLKTDFHCVILTIWIQHPYFISFFEIPLLMNSQETVFHSSPWFKLTKSSVVFFQLVKLFSSNSFGFGTDHSSQILLGLLSIIYNVPLK